MLYTSSALDFWEIDTRFGTCNVISLWTAGSLKTVASELPAFLYVMQKSTCNLLKKKAVVHDKKVAPMKI
jgi:hypothetical protein